MPQPRTQKATNNAASFRPPLTRSKVVGFTTYIKENEHATA